MEGQKWRSTSKIWSADPNPDPRFISYRPQSPAKDAFTRPTLTHHHENVPRLRAASGPGRPLVILRGETGNPETEEH